MHEALHKMEDPIRHVHLLENIEKEGVVYRVKSFRCVDEEEKLLLLL